MDCPNCSGTMQRVEDEEVEIVSFDDVEKLDDDPGYVCIDCGYKEDAGSRE